MNRAVQNEQFAVRQKLADAYTVQVKALSAHLNTYWSDHLSALDRLSGRAAAEQFESVVAAKTADGFLSRALEYPDVLGPVNAEPQIPGWQEARNGEDFGRLALAQTNLDMRAIALQAAAREFRLEGKTNAALEVFLRLGDPEFETARDIHGRLLAPAADLAALELLPNEDARRETVLSRLRRRVAHANTLMPSPQRRFLMAELAEKTGDAWLKELLRAEAFSERARSLVNWDGAFLQFHESAGFVAVQKKGRALLFRAADLPKRPEAGMGGIANDDTEIRIAKGDPPLGFLAAAPVPLLAGWHVAAKPADPELFNELARQREAAYIWAGLLVVAAVGLVSLAAARTLLRQTQQTRLKNDLLANVTHELKTPLASTRLLVETLLDSPRVTDTATREYLELIARENRRLGSLIENFLAFSRMERNKFALDLKPVAPAEITAQAADAVRDKFAAAGARFATQVDEDLPLVKADTDSLVTALVNLLENAFKYSGSEKQIALRAAQQHGNVCFSVEDNGIGIPPRERSKIFRRFYQIDQSLSRRSGGCGLGLSIVDFIVRAHGGKVAVESELGAGSVFTISLPAVQRSVTPAPEEAIA